MAIRTLAKRVLARVAKLVEKDDLFEKPGERARAEPLPVAPPKKGAPPKKAEAPAKVEAPKPAVAKVEAPVAEAPKPPVAEAPKAPAAEAPKPPVAVEPAPATSPVYRWPGVSAQRPAEGCVVVGVDGLKAALTPNGKPLVINHWATWCDPCVDELPRLVRAAAGVADIGEFVGVSWDLFDHPGKPALVAKKVGKFADSAGVGYPSVLFVGKPEELFALCGLDVQLVPQTLVVAPDGRVTFHKKGVIDHDDVFPLIRAVKEAAGR